MKWQLMPIWPAYMVVWLKDHAHEDCVHRPRYWVDDDLISGRPCPGRDEGWGIGCSSRSETRRDRPPGEFFCGAPIKIGGINQSPIVSIGRGPLYGPRCIRPSWAAFPIPRHPQVAQNRSLVRRQTPTPSLVAWGSLFYGGSTLF